MTGPGIGPDGYYHPANDDEVGNLIRWAAANGRQVRVRGAAHSVAAAVYGGDPRTGAGGVNLLLDRMANIELDGSRLQVTVQAGCHLGYNPMDPSGGSTLENSLFHRLDRAGWALLTTGGIMHQTVGGFLSTGSSGGSLEFSIYEAVVAIRIIDGRGRPVDYRRPQGAAPDSRDPFFGAVISMGLLGVVTQVTLQCVPRYHVLGDEIRTSLEDSRLRLFEGGPEGLEVYLRSHEHAKVVWWPQKRVGKLLAWKGRQFQAADYNEATGTPTDFRPKPFELLPPILGSTRLTERLANWVFRVFSPLNPPPPTTMPARVRNTLLGFCFPAVVNLMLGRSRPSDPAHFWDVWWRALPMDNAASDELLPTEFTEAWVPLQHTVAVLTALRDHYEAGGFRATGTYACEIYAARASRMWLSPAYGEDKLRIDLFWFAGNRSDPERDYFPQFWKLLDRFAPRYHWGKYFPTCPGELTARYPMWPAFVDLRRRHDPGGVFVTPYWRSKLGIEGI